MTGAGLGRRLLAELLGSAFLAAIVIGSGIAAQNLSPGNAGLELLENAAATAAGLYAIILMFGPVSGAHFNPVVSFVDASFGGVTWRTATAYLPAQVAGCIGGAVLANLMFSKAAVSISTHHRASPAHFLSEVVATLGLILVIFSLARSGRSRSAAAAVGAYIGAAYFFTSSTSFANPAITVGRMFSDTFAGISPSSVPSFVAAQIAGGALAVLVIKVLYPDITPAEAADIMSPHTAGPETRGLLTSRDRRRTRHDRPSVRPVPLRPQRWAQSGGTGASRSLRQGAHPGGVGRFGAGKRTESVRRGRLEGAGCRSLPGVPEAVDRRGRTDCGCRSDHGLRGHLPVFPGKRYLDWDLDDPAGLSSSGCDPSWTRSTKGSGRCSQNSRPPTVDR